MTRRDPSETIGLWLEEGPVVVSTESRRQMLGEILATPQSGRWRIRFRPTSAISPVSLGLSAAAVVILVVAGAVGFNSSLPSIGGPLAPSATLTPPSPGSSVRPGASVDTSCEVARAAAPKQPPSTAQTTEGPPAPTGGRSLDAGPLPAGTIELEALDPQIGLRLGSGWSGGYENDDGDAVQAPPGKVSIFHELVAGGYVRIGFWDTTDLTIIHPISRQEMSAPSDFVAFLLEVESFGDCRLTSLELDGKTATRVDFDWTVDRRVWFIPPVKGSRAPGHEFHPSQRQHWVVPGDGQLLISWTVEGSPSRTAAEFEADRLVKHVLETLESSPGS